MSKSRLHGRLARLATSPYCRGIDAPRYVEELRALAAKVADRTSATKESRFLKALADDSRVRMLRLLMERRMCVCEIMAALDLTQPTASHHLGVLEKESILERKKEGKWAYYSVSNSRIVELMRRLESLR